MFRLEQAPHKPLPVIQRRIRDELLSSWLTRCARFYKANALQLINHMGIACAPHPAYRTWSDQVERALDFRPAAPIVRRIAWCLHVREATISEHTHLIGLSDVGSESFVKIGGMPLPCRHCHRVFASMECPAELKSWVEPWRIQCGRCLRPYNIGNQTSSGRRDYRLYGPQKIAPRLWRDALRGSAIVDRWLRREPCGLIPPPWVMRLLKQSLARNRAARNSRLLSVLVPEAATGVFRPSQTHVDLRSSSLPDRVSVLAGIARFNDTPQLCLNRLMAKTTPSGRKTINDLLNALPNVIADELRGCRHEQVPRQHGALTVLAHTLSRKLGANLRQIDSFCRELRA